MQAHGSAYGFEDKERAERKNCGGVKPGYSFAFQPTQGVGVAMHQQECGLLVVQLRALKPLARNRASMWHKKCVCHIAKRKQRSRWCMHGKIMVRLAHSIFMSIAYGATSTYQCPWCHWTTLMLISVAYSTMVKYHKNMFMCQQGRVGWNHWVRNEANGATDLESCQCQSHIVWSALVMKTGACWLLVKGLLCQLTPR